MARIEGVESLIAQLTEIGSAVQSEQTVEIARKSWDIVRDEIRANAISAGHVFTGLLIDPKTILTNAGKSKNASGTIIFAEAGVFKDDSAMARFGLNPKTDIPRGMVAYWLEFGTQEHYNIKGLRARKTPVTEGDKGSRGASTTAAIKPTKFISRAFDAKADLAFNVFRQDMGLLIDKAANN